MKRPLLSPISARDPRMGIKFYFSCSSINLKCAGSPVLEVRLTKNLHVKRGQVLNTSHRLKMLLSSAWFLNLANFSWRGLNSYLVLVILLHTKVYFLRLVLSKNSNTGEFVLTYQSIPSIKISGWSGVRFSVRFPVFVLLLVILQKFQCRWICIGK